MNLHSANVSVSHDPTSAAGDAYLDLPLHGVQLIEASAGTGKTFTLATLVTRLVVERGLRVGQILAVTYTEAATQELRARLRKRLELVARVAGEFTDEAPAAFPADPATSAPRGHDASAEAELARTLIRRQLHHEDGAALRARLQRAAREVDLAAVFTIHGFCTRVLGEHALETGQAFDPPELVGSDRELRDELAADLWRAFGADPVDAELLQTLWSTGPAALAADLAALLRATQLLPAAPDPTPDPTPALQQALTDLRAAFARHAVDARACIDAAIAAKHLDGRKARPASYQQAWEVLADGLASGRLARDDNHLDKLTPARLLECAKAGCEDKVPASPLFDALADWFAADAARGQWLAGQTVGLLHRIRDEAGRRLAELKRRRRLQTFDDLIDGVADALDGARGDALVAKLRAQYAVALVDEFQDTDARQWGIFRRVFGEGDEADAACDDARADGAQARFLVPAVEHSSPALGTAQAGGLQTRFLALIGDPKQAIYRFRGGDVHTYLRAAAVADKAPALSQNFRSRPGVLRAIEALYAQAGAAAFVDERIRFHPVQPGAGIDDRDHLRDGTTVAALTIRELPAAADGKPWKIDDSRALATRACVAEIHALLGDARAGRATIKTKSGDVPVEPGDIAVLVREHKEAARMQAALVAAGIPAVAAGKQSLFATEQAEELLALFAALLQPADEGRLRAALATVLLGVDGVGIDRLDHDDDWRRRTQLQALDWRERWQRHGPLALVSDLCAAHAERLLGLADGERRLTNLLQLGEALQDADRRALGLHGLVDWLRQRIAEADPNDEQQQLRLESDARRVQILTLHKSKGLEFPLVFLPFVGIGKEAKPGRHCDVPDIDGRVLHWHAGGEAHAAAWHDASQTWHQEQRAEDARLLYVGLTRARHALWLATGPLYRAADAALHAMLGDRDALRAHPDIVFDAAPLADPPVPLPPAAAAAPPRARHAARTLSRDWWVYSFTQLAHADGGIDRSAPVGVDERGATDEPTLPASDADGETAPFDRRFSGSRFGNVLHDALEHVDFAAWSDWRVDRNDGAAPDGQAAPLRTALRGEGYPDTDLDDGVAALTPLVGHTLTVALPEGGRLCELPPDARRAELEFHFALQPTPVDTLIATLHAHGVLRGRSAFGLRRQLEGLMTGKIDLTYTAGGRWYLLDYKSNRLPAYDAASLERAMAHSEYDLQALIYTVALHRWLRFRLGDRYDYARDFGGVRYLFCRGLDAGAGEATGIHGHQPPVALVDAVDRLFGGPP